MIRQPNEKELRQQLPGYSTEGYEPKEIAWLVRLHAESHVDWGLHDFSNGQDFINHLAEPDENSYDMDTRSLSKSARLQLAQVAIDERGDEWLWHRPNRLVPAMPLTNKSILDTITEAANDAVTMKVTMTLHALAEQLRDELTSLGAQDLYFTRVSPEDPNDKLIMEGIQRVDHPLGHLTYYPMHSGERMVLYVQDWDFYITFICQVCHGLGNCGTCHDMSGADRIA